MGARDNPPGSSLNPGEEREERRAPDPRNREKLAGVATDGTADTLKVDVTSHDEHRVRWHTRDDTPPAPALQGWVQTLGQRVSMDGSRPGTARLQERAQRLGPCASKEWVQRPGPRISKGWVQRPGPRISKGWVQRLGSCGSQR